MFSENSFCVLGRQNTILAVVNNPRPVGRSRGESHMPMTVPYIETLVVAGASARAIAESAARAGWRVHAADLFADLDLRAVAAVAEIARPYPAALPAIVAGFPPGPWLYCGAVENHPQLIAAISESRPLAGCSPAAVAEVRDPTRLSVAIRAAGLGFPETRRDAVGIPRDGSWLVKPLRSAGGHGIAAWQGDAGMTAGAADHVWQQRVRGRPWSVSYLFAARGCRLLGCSRQLLGRRWCHAPPFGFCGSVDIAPDSLPAGVHDQLCRLGSLLTDSFDLVGLVGVDFILDDHGLVHVIEVNPRPTSSMELIERATGLSLAAAHLAACGVSSPSAAEARTRRGSWSKAILYASADMTIDDQALAALRSGAGALFDGWPMVADLPTPPQTIPAGGPVCTIFAHDESPPRSLAVLRRRVQALSLRVAAPWGADRHGTASGTHLRSSLDRSP